MQNLTTGKVSSLVISPPTGAAASGNCAEWIMETPGLGQSHSLASLPRFSPVYFTGATAVPTPGITNPPPTSKDTINITRDGHAQTVSAYGDQTVTVTYVGIGWYPIHGEATFDHAHQHVSAVSRAAGNLDLFAIGSDNRAYTTSWTHAGGWDPGGWSVLGASHFDHTTQRIAAVSRDPGSLDLLVIGIDDVVYWLPRSSGGWAVEWQPLSSEVTFDHTSQQIEAVARTPGDIDVFVIGGDNIVRSQHWLSFTSWA
jgi:hypothetical protein